MKIRLTHMAYLTAFFAMPASQAFQAPADDAPPPPPVQAGEAAPSDQVERDMPEADPAVGEQAGYLGINVSGIPDMLGVHIDVPAGQGVLVRVVAPDSAADEAGMRVHDVILKVAGEAVASHQDVSRIVAGHQAGETVELEFLRKGERQVVEAVLDARPAAPMAAQPRGRDAHGLGMNEMFFEDLPQDQAARIRDMVERNLRALREPGGLMEDELFNDAFRGMQDQMRQLLEDPEQFAPLDGDGRGFGNIRMNAGTTVRLMDAEGSVELKAVEDSKEVTVRDLDNEIIWTGPWDTDQDKAAAPDDVRERIERLNIERFQGGNGLRLQFFGDR